LPGRFHYEHIFNDNASTDSTVAVLKRLAALDPNVTIIVNARNFGAIRSSTHALTHARGDAVISIVADFQDPPELILTLIVGREPAYSVVIGIKRSS
jgi:glycosyltransferase involved in cell wall biosynthesis